MIEHGDGVPGEHRFLCLVSRTAAERGDDGIAILMAEFGSAQQHRVEADHEERERPAPVKVAKGADGDAGPGGG